MRSTPIRFYAEDLEALRRAKVILQKMGEHEGELYPLLAPAVFAVPKAWAPLVKELEKVHAALERLSKVTIGLLNQAMLVAEDSPRRSFWGQWRGVSRAETILTAVDLAIEAAQGQVRTGPQSSQEAERYALRLAELCARSGHRPPTGRPSDPPRHVYHQLVRDAFAAWGFGGWRDHAREAARTLAKDFPGAQRGKKGG